MFHYILKKQNYPCKAPIELAKVILQYLDLNQLFYLIKMVMSCNTTVLMALGNVIVLSAVGSVTVNVVSLPSSVAFKYYR